MYTSPILGSLIAILLAAFFALFMYASHGPQSAQSLALFQFIPEGLIHTTGVVVMILVFLAGLAGVATMARGDLQERGHLRARRGRQPRRPGSARHERCGSPSGVESLGQQRYRVDCETVQEARPWYRRRWFIHAATMWGFLGLLAATILDYGLAVVGIKATGTPVPIWYPVRLLGTVAGMALIYGTTMLIVDRLRRANRSAGDSTAADWTLLALLWITGHHRVPHRAGAVPAAGAGVGLLGLPLPRVGGDGTRPARTVHEVLARRLSTGRAVLLRTWPRAPRRAGQVGLNERSARDAHAARRPVTRITSGCCTRSTGCRPLRT